MKAFAVVPVSRPAASRTGSPGVRWIEPSRCDVPRLRWPFLPALSSLTACTALAVSKGALSRSGRRPQAQAKPRRRVALVEASRGKTSRTGARRGLHSAGPVLSTGTLPVGDGFDLYYEEHGSPDGIPVVFLHGGPGAGCSRRMAQLFDPEKYRVILFDQRGCGKSSRKDSANAEDQLEGNTTWHLVEDLEVLRAHLKIDRWVVCGGSWGTCLALAYASKHPACVLGMVLRAVFLFRNEELEYFCGPKGGARSLARGAWDSFAGWLPWAETRSARAIAAAFRRAALGEDASVSPTDALSKWRAWENHLFAQRAKNLKLQPSKLSSDLPEAKVPAKPWPKPGKFNVQALLTLHYVAERGFFPEGSELLDSAAAFAFPLKLVHGQNDCICPAVNAEDLARAVGPSAELLLTDGGHSQWDVGNIDAFVRATDQVAAECLVSS
ncbi:PIP [Symbiodinium sp. CCMP2456]|nr:PIP [Symbiodinium sp. CCMP2456]